LRRWDRHRQRIPPLRGHRPTRDLLHRRRGPDPLSLCRSARRRHASGLPGEAGPVSRRRLGVAAAVALVTIGLLSAFIGVHGNLGGGGTLLVELSSKSGDSVGDTLVELHSRSGWSSLAHVANTAVPAAPKTITVASADVAPGSYDGIRLAGADLSV